MNLQTLIGAGAASFSHITKTPNLREGDVESKRQEILDYFHNTYSLYESLFDCLDGDSVFYARANPLRHPLIFYYGHTAVFFINKLNVAGYINTRIDEELESTLAVGVDEMSWDDLDENHYNWPSPARVKAYRDQARALIDDFIRALDITLPTEWDSPLWIIMMGIEHERIHLETSSVLIRELPINAVKSHPFWSNICEENGPAPLNSLIEVAGGDVLLGKSKVDAYYGWDNEYGSALEQVNGFKASKYLVSNGEFLAFVQDGGYTTRDYWDDEGWGWVRYREAEHPVFWIPDGDSYKYRAMLQIIDMPWNWPVDINYLEARAFCAWKSAKTGKSIRMPSEAEWTLLRTMEPSDQPTWESAPGNINLEYGTSSCPVNRHEFTNGFFDIIGNVWQWTETPINGFMGFEVHKAYDDFSTPTFDGKHNLFKGGCWASTGNYAIKQSRYAFRRHFYQHSGLRYIEAEALPPQDIMVAEKDPAIAQDIDAHYGASHHGVPNFSATLAGYIRLALEDQPTLRALDIGCGAGRLSFELAKHFDHVDGVDFSVRHIEAPANLQRSGLQRYELKTEGELVSHHEIKIADFEGYAAVKDKIAFMQGDACNLHDKYANYDLIVAANLVEHLYDPTQFLRMVHERLNKGGILVLTSTYDWQEEHTARDHWLGGFKAQTGENYLSLEGVASILGDSFELISKPVDIPVIEKRSSRRFELGVSELTIWRHV